jgi:hypothetical protein
VNRKILVIISVSVSVATVIALSIGLPLYFHYSSIFYPDVTIVSYQLNPEAGEEWTLNVSTYLLNTCYLMKSPVIEFSEKYEYTIYIILKAKKTSRFDRGLLCEIIRTGFDYQFQIVFPLSGNWTVHCNDKTITVYVQKPCFC